MRRIAIAMLVCVWIGCLGLERVPASRCRLRRCLPVTGAGDAGGDPRAGRTLPMVETPQVKLPPVPVASNAKAPRRSAKKPEGNLSAEPVQPAAVTPRASCRRHGGRLADPGGETNPQTKQAGGGLDCVERKAIECAAAAEG